MVKVYSFEGCPWCDKVKKFLQARGVEYETRDIEESEEARAECEKISGDLAVPVTTIDGKNYVVGFDKRKIEELLASA
ncbi:MAG: glutaredoxin family protein [Selenomonadaceae bacterium]|nr:glutaredoxin family protein [Selenomonadaceae bacterium]